jgi:hypothetical protein
MSNEKYNGWNNYETWRIHLEILGDIEFDEPVTVNQLKEIVEDVVFSQFNDKQLYLMEGYARAFISEVDFYEIMENINEELALQN